MQGDTESTQLLTVREVSERLGISQPSVYRLLDSGHLPWVHGGIRYPGKRVREADLAEFIQRRTEGEVA